MIDYIIVFSFFGTFVAITMFLSNLNSKIKNMDKRNKKIKELENKGYTISKRWDCNFITVGIDDVTKKLFMIVLDRKSSFFEIDINDINSYKIDNSKIVKGFINSIFIDFFMKNNMTYTVRTLCITRGFGITSKNPSAKYALECAKEICFHIDSLKSK